jgi:hypothetical protein
MTSRVFECADCGNGPNCPMLKDEVWDTFAGRKELLCFKCAEERLGSHITMKDLRGCLGNDWGVLVAKRACPSLDISSYESVKRIERNLS